METSVIDWKERRVSVFYSNVNKIFLGTDGAASLRVGQILPLRVEGSIPYSAPLNVHARDSELFGITLNTKSPQGTWYTCHKIGITIEI